METATMRDARPQAISVREGASLRELTRLWQELCNCGGRQPSLRNAHTEDHALDCLYVVKVESDTGFKAREAEHHG